MNNFIFGEVSLGALTPARIYELVYEQKSGTFILESGFAGSLNGEFSILGSFSRSVIRGDENKTEIFDDGKWRSASEPPISLLNQFIKKKSSADKQTSSFFSGGLVGFFGYEVLQLFEKIRLKNKEHFDLPLYYLGVTDEVIIIDHLIKKISIYIYYEESERAEGYADRLKRIKNILKNSMTERKDIFFHAHSLLASSDKKSFMDMVKRAKDYIKEGDIFQANLSQQFSADFMGSSWGFYLRLKEINPTPFQGYINFGDIQIISGSPERLIKVKNGTIETRPIAGTRPRGKDSKEDVRLSEELILNEKERAEHLMLVDLQRNDLGRVCEYGSVEVEDFMALEPYSHVWHIVSKVVGVLKKEVTIPEILRSCFPGGTITGCPKVRCMEIIDELEPFRRGIYTGSMGYIGWNGQIDLNILIRSAVVINGKILFCAGAGIVADSDPEAEYLETINKAKAIIEALGLEKDLLLLLANKG